MGGLAITNETLEKYFGFLSKLDNSSKKKLIIKLTESLDITDSKNLFGAWEDSKDSDEIIKEIRNSRVNGRDIVDF